MKPFAIKNSTFYNGNFNCGAPNIFLVTMWILLFPILDQWDIFLSIVIGTKNS